MAKKVICCNKQFKGTEEIWWRPRNGGEYESTRPRHPDAWEKHKTDEYKRYYCGSPQEEETYWFCSDCVRKNGFAW